MLNHALSGRLDTASDSSCLATSMRVARWSLTMRPYIGSSIEPEMSITNVTRVDSTWMPKNLEPDTVRCS